jgi:hypothetical protein
MKYAFIAAAAALLLCACAETPTAAASASAPKQTAADCRADAPIGSNIPRKSDCGPRQ